MNHNADDISSLVNWGAFERETIQAIRSAVGECRRLCGDFQQDPISQVSIWTDAQAQTTCISFETQAHGADRNRSAVEVMRKYGGTTEAIQLARLGYNPDPAVFKYHKFYCARQPLLLPLQLIDYSNAEQSELADSLIERSLISAVQHAAKEEVFAQLPTGGSLWIGVSSVIDWYDHVGTMDDWRCGNQKPRPIRTQPE